MIYNFNNFWNSCGATIRSTISGSRTAFDMPTGDFFAGADGRTLLDVIALPRVLDLLERVIAPREQLRCCGVQVILTVEPVFCRRWPVRLP